MENHKINLADLIDLLKRSTHPWVAFKRPHEDCQISPAICDHIVRSTIEDLRDLGLLNESKIDIRTGEIETKE